MRFDEVVLWLFIPLAIGTFFYMRPLSATLLVLLGAELFLPLGAEIKFPLCPMFGKHNIPYLCVAIGCLLRSPSTFFRSPRIPWLKALVVAAMSFGILTGLTNDDPIPVGTNGVVVLAPLTFKDGVFIGITEFFPNLLALYLGYVIVREPDDVEKVLRALGIAGLVYCPFAIVEMRMSPQFHYWVYGYEVGQFLQSIRYGGYRPKVFMAHGLALARIFMITTMALFVLQKTRRTLLGMPTWMLAWFHLVVLILCKSTGAIVMTIFGVFCVARTKPKTQLLMASLIALVTILYPFLRASDLFPTEKVLELSAQYANQDRADSMAFRFNNENQLLVRSRERIWFGWGNSRGRVFNEEGNLASVVDGYWIMALNGTGVAGFLVCFGSLVWPILLSRFRLSRLEEKPAVTNLAGLSLMIALYTADLIPNGGWCVIHFFLAGVLTRLVRPNVLTSSEVPAGGRTQ